MAKSSEGLVVLILGVTGYIGGAIGVSLKKKHPTSIYKAFVRSAEAAEAVKAAGFEVVQGTGNAEWDRNVVAKEAADADVVINTADADDLELVNSILEALKNSVKELPILIHTSGTGVLADLPTGGFQETAKKIWDDSKPEDIKAIGPNQPHRNVDLAIFNAGKEDYFIGYIIAPSTIYGVAFDNPGNRISQQIPALIRASVERHQTVYGGEGTNVWNNVHVFDLADLYILIFEKALSERARGKPTSSDPYERFYFGSVRSHAWGDVAKRLATILYGKGVVDNDKAISIAAKELPKAITVNSQSVSNRGLFDGWTPSRAKLEDTLEEDAVATLAQLGVR
ncbi:NAD(P)-binding protein [Cantharellus anzutake]|uniref:NAD(P)-binding protein n=1 Tax=Cantharellus anzutake TaxID=1750568 RepID=UPI001903F38E|nr:NAD(P)-binding protein [Cantharellus anzutake]KAF8325838.1 NAD(P)-binding protein [Cantharellus anzutake]